MDAPEAFDGPARNRDSIPRRFCFARMSAVPPPAAPPPTAAVPAGGTPPFLRALRSRNFRLFFCGQIVSLIGTWMTTTASLWLAYHLTGSALLLGLVGFAGQAPIFFLSPLAGVWVDRVDKRRLLIVHADARPAAIRRAGRC